LTRLLVGIGHAWGGIWVVNMSDGVVACSLIIAVAIECLREGLEKNKKVRKLY